LFDPNDVESIEQALMRLCFDNTRRAELIAAGARRISLFSWDRCAVTLEAYRPCCKVAWAR
jgi:glycosyltransferase involved in cell wall biosynthesis